MYNVFACGRACVRAAGCACVLVAECVKCCVSFYLEHVTIYLDDAIIEANP